MVIINPLLMVIKHIDHSSYGLHLMSPAGTQLTDTLGSLAAAAEASWPLSRPVLPGEVPRFHRIL